ncbi:hypothetical protein [Streptomyces sp. NPDC052192]|uniref:hypothetical protein n=1 Tax=Streptomyces sp. NPDC052192 TaxID=3155052 RepID=UPI003437925D
MQSIKRFMARTAMAVALAAAALSAAPNSASAVEAHPQFWNYKCDDGRACVYHTDGNVWNIEGCGVSGLNDHYNYAKAHGNSFRIWFKDARNGAPWGFVDVPAWTEVSLASEVGKLAYRVQVFC